MTLSKKFIQEIKKELEAKKKKLEDELADFTVKTGRGSKVDFPDYGDKSGENASEVATFNNDVSLKNVLEKDLRDINNTLKRINDDSFGVCKYCGVDIPEPRLKARPTSSACIDCKKKFSGEA